MSGVTGVSYPDKLRIEPVSPFSVSLLLPGSKSLTNRAMLLAALAEGESVLEHVLVADDAVYMRRALEQLGVSVRDVPGGVRVVGRASAGANSPQAGAGSASSATVAGVGPEAQDRTGAATPDGSAIKLFLGNAGTAYRFLTAALAGGLGCFPAVGQGHWPEVAGGSGGVTGQSTEQLPGTLPGVGAGTGAAAVELDGVERMRERPIGELVAGLRALGGEIAYLGREGYPPLRVTCRRLKGGTLQLPPTQSSQFISALMQLGPYLAGGLRLCFRGPVTSRPYVWMTARLMEMFGAKVWIAEDWCELRVEEGGYQGRRLVIEPDASAASYFWAAAALVPGSRCRIEGLGEGSLQGDSRVVEVMERMGARVEREPEAVVVSSPVSGEVLRGVDVDLNDMPDMAQTLAVMALFARGPSRFRRIGNLRVKETDRLAALECELSKLGAEVVVDGDDLIVRPPEGGVEGRLRPAEIATYDDHRMAMSFAVAGLRSDGVTICDPGCVSKTFPEFFDYLARLREG